MSLAIYRQIIEGDGGQIWAKSCLAIGSTLYRTLSKLIQSEENRHE
ncbi:hypothetical protein [Myxosarcina sp. GI1(2024)]